LPVVSKLALLPSGWMTVWRSSKPAAREAAYSDRIVVPWPSVTACSKTEPSSFQPSPSED